MPMNTSPAPQESMAMDAQEGAEGGGDELSKLEADAQALLQAIEAAKSGQEGAEEALSEAASNMQDCLAELGGGGEGEEGAPEGEAPMDEAPVGEEGAPGGEGEGAEAESGDQFAPHRDGFHGYSASGRARSNFSGDTFMPSNDPVNFDASDPGELFAANPQAAFAGLVDVVAQIPSSLDAISKRLGAIEQRNKLGEQSSAFSAARTEFQAFLDSEETKQHLFDASSALATFDACKGHKPTVDSLKKMILSQPKVDSITPADAGQIFDAGSTVQRTGQPTNFGSNSRPLRMSEIMPGSADDEKLNSLGAKVGAGYK